MCNSNTSYYKSSSVSGRIWKALEDTTTMSAEGFDVFVAETAEALADEINLDEKVRDLEEINAGLSEVAWASMSEQEVRELVNSIQDVLMPEESELRAMDIALFESMEILYLATRTEGSEEFEIPDELEGIEDDLTYDVGTQHDAGARMMERNERLKETTTERFLVAWQKEITAVKAEELGITEYLEGLEEFTEWRVLEKQTGDDAEWHERILSSAWGLKSQMNYLNMVSNAWLGVSRNMGIAGVCKAGGYERCMIVAELDERTSHICRFLHGKEVVLDAMIAETAGLMEPNSKGTMLSESPDLYVGSVDATEKQPHIYLPGPRGEKRLLAVRKGPHLWGDPEYDMGSYDQYIGDEELSRSIGAPPYHFLCRTLVVPIDYPDILEFRADIDIKE